LKVTTLNTIIDIVYRNNKDENIKYIIDYHFYTVPIDHDKTVMDFISIFQQNISHIVVVACHIFQLISYVYVVTRC